MNQLDELIKELCPNGVEYKRIGEIAEISRGRVMSKIYIKENEGVYPVYSSQTENNGELGKISTYDFDGEYLTWTTDGANAGSVFFRDGKFSVTNVCGLIKIINNKVLVKFVYYFLSIEAKKHVNSGMGNPKLMSNVMAKINVPIPPLPVQEEIVRILDNFTELTNELTDKLTAELTARKKQYEYYRDSLFEFGDQTPKVKLGDIASINRGGNFQKKDFSEEGVPCIHYGQIYTYYGIYTYETLTFLSEQVAKKSKKAMKNDVIMAVTSENVEDVCKCVTWLGDEDVCVSGHTAIIQHNQNPKYLSYFFHSSNFFSQKLKLAHGTKVIEVTPSTLKNVMIPLPSLEEQQRIVDILDRFDKLCNDISEGLPAEIEARQKQYEYYRDKLLTFKPLEEVK